MGYRSLDRAYWSALSWRADRISDFVAGRMRAEPTRARGQHRPMDPDSRHGMGKKTGLRTSRLATTPDVPTPDISIVVPCYNAAETVSDTLASIQAQTCENWEVICVDDGSTDRTAELLGACAESDPRIRWTQGPHRCPAAARNRGLALARSDRVLFLDADDVTRPEALTVLLKASRATGPGAIVSAGFELLDQQGKPLSVFHFPSVPDYSVDALLRSNRIPSMTLVPRSVLGSRPFDEDERKRGCEDWDLWLRLAHAGVGCVTVPRVLFGYRLRAGSLSHSADRMYASACRVLEAWMPLANNPDIVCDAAHRAAFHYGAIALASGKPEAIHGYLRTLGPLDPAPDFLAHVAAAINNAFLFVHGARGETWRTNRETWLGQGRAWLLNSPLAAYTDEILEHTLPFAMNPHDRFNRVVAFLEQCASAKTILVYGIGPNGLAVLERLRSHPCLGRRSLGVADDFAGANQLVALDLPIDDPRCWEAWPEGTLVLITPNDSDGMQATLLRIGGREGVDFIALAHEVEPERVYQTARDLS